MKPEPRRPAADLRPARPRAARARASAWLALASVSLGTACAAVLGFEDTAVTDQPLGQDGGPDAAPTTTPPDGEGGPTPDPDGGPPPGVDGGVDASLDGGRDGGDAAADADVPSDAGAPHPGCLRLSVDAPTTAIQPQRDGAEVLFVVTDSALDLAAPRIEICTPASRTTVNLTLRQTSNVAPFTYESAKAVLPAGTSQVVLLTGQVFPAVRETLFYAR